MSMKNKVIRGPASPRRLRRGGYTLIELIIAIGLFALIMMLASGAYLVMIGINRQTQGIATGIDNLSFALETMTRTIRTGADYSSGGTSFSVTNSSGETVNYSLANNVIYQNSDPLTDPSVSVSSLRFYASGTASGDSEQSRVTIIVSGYVSYAAGKREDFTVETGATMRGSDL